jgi:hypothetical protein
MDGTKSYKERFSIYLLTAAGVEVVWHRLSNWPFPLPQSTQTFFTDLQSKHMAFNK